MRRSHPLATLHGGDTRADVDDDARAVPHWDTLGGFAASVATREDIEIAMVECCGAHLHHDFACAGRRRRALDERERTDALLGADLISAHRRCAGRGGR